MSQTAAILRHLKAGRPLTPLGALKLFGVFRLSARVAELRQKGLKVRTKIVRVGQKRVAEYRL